MLMFKRLLQIENLLVLHVKNFVYKPVVKLVVGLFLMPVDLYEYDIRGRRGDRSCVLD